MRCSKQKTRRSLLPRQRFIYDSITKTAEGDAVAPPPDVLPMPIFTSGFKRDGDVVDSNAGASASMETPAAPEEDTDDSSSSRSLNSEGIEELNKKFWALKRKYGVMMGTVSFK